MEVLAQTLPDDEREILTEKIDGLKQIIKVNKHRSPFRRKIMIDKISRINIKDPEKRKELYKLAQGFPTSEDLDSAWIVKYSGKKSDGTTWTSKEIAKRLLEFSMPNTDHIKSYLDNRNNDDISNYLAMHSGCNTNKDDKTFNAWYMEDPVRRTQSMVKYFEKVDELITSKQLKDKKYKNYVQLAADTIKETSLGFVDLSSSLKKDNDNE